MNNSAVDNRRSLGTSVDGAARSTVRGPTRHTVPCSVPSPAAGKR
jgi:hypothetical protein